MSFSRTLIEATALGFNPKSTSGAAAIASALGAFSANISTPSGFRWTSHGMNIRRKPDGSVITDFDITLLTPAITTTYYVDPVGGSNGNAGTSRGLPLKDLATALAKSDVDQIRIINLTGDYIARTTQTWNNVQPTRSLSVVVEGGYRYIMVGSKWYIR